MRWHRSFDGTSLFISQLFLSVSCVLCMALLWASIINLKPLPVAFRSIIQDRLISHAGKGLVDFFILKID